MFVYHNSNSYLNNFKTLCLINTTFTFYINQSLFFYYICLFLFVQRNIVKTLPNFGVWVVSKCLTSDQSVCQLVCLSLLPYLDLRSF